MTFLIRPYALADLEAVAAIDAANYPEFRTTPEELLHHDDNRQKGTVHERWVAVEAGSVIGFADLGQHHWMLAADAFDVMVHVGEGSRRQGVGTALWDALAARLEELGAAKARCWLAETVAPGQQFARERGFAEAMRERESRLDLASWDPSPWRPAIDRVLAQGVELLTLEDTGAGPEVLHKIYEADVEFTKDMPSPDEITRPDESGWVARLLESPRYRPDLNLTAWEDGEVLGCSTLVEPPGTPHLLVGTTGVVGRHRRRGVGTALKARVQEMAKEQGHAGIYTWNETGNTGMLAINAAMGFVPEKDWCSMALDLRSGPEE